MAVSGRPVSSSARNLLSSPRGRHAYEDPIIDRFQARSARPTSANSAGSYGPIDALHSDHVINHINEPEPAHPQPVILTLVKTLRRVGV
jgi:hypothetical protein